MRLKRQIAWMGLLLALLVSGTVCLGQEEPAAKSAPTDDDGKKRPFALYVEAATGGYAAEDLSTDLATSVLQISDSVLSIDEVAYAKAAIGWKLQHGKGDFRLNFHGYREDNYLFAADGYSGALLGVDVQPGFNDNPLWWTVRVEDGRMQTERTSPYWGAPGEPNPDTNNNSFFDAGEVWYADEPDLQMSKNVTDDLQNRIQFVDLLYGRTFGNRTFSARWWSGLRYFVYDGNIPVAAWLFMEKPGLGFTDGFFARPLQFSEATSGWGPTGILEGDFKLLDERLVFYLQGQVALMLLDLETDSGPFLTYVQPPNEEHIIPTPARIHETRNKSTWQDALEVGVRLHLKNGLQLEFAYNITGLLDMVLLPVEIKIPNTVLQFGTSPLYDTRDLIFEGWRAGIAFQF